MQNTLRLLLLIIIIIILSYSIYGHFIYGHDINESLTECTSCDSYRKPDCDSVLLNPFVWPWSGTNSPDDIRVLEKDRDVNENADVPIVSASVPDHAATTN